MAIKNSLKHSKKGGKGKKKGRGKKKKKIIAESPGQTRDVLVAAEKGDIANLKHVLENPDRQINLNGLCADALHLAAEGGFADCVKVLLENGQNPNINNGKALMKASARGHFEVVRTILEHNGNPNLTSVFSDFTPLHFACEYGNRDTVLTLLEHGADVNARTHPEYNSVHSGWCPLHFAADLGHEGCVHALLQYMAPVDQKTAQGDTAAALASEHGKFSVVRLLVSLGANTGETRRGLNLIQWACYRCDIETVEYLSSYGAFADLTIRVPWFAPTASTGKNSHQHVSLCQQMKLDVSEDIWKAIDVAIYRGGKKFHLRAAHMKLISDMKWTVDVAVVADEIDGMDMDVLPSDEIVKRSYQFPPNVVEHICQYEL